MRYKFNEYFVGILVGMFLVTVSLSLGHSLFKQRGRIKKIVKYYIYNFSKPKVKKQDRFLGEDVDTNKEISIKIDLSKEINNISELLYGTNLSPQMESSKDIEQFVKDRGITSFRFPGGGSPGYHWKTGKSDFDWRLRNTPLSNIDYVIDFCKRTNTKLIIQVNIESGTPQEAAEWVEYMNKKVGFYVKYWELGNEVYGDWDKGYMSASKYSEVIKEYSIAMKKVDPNIKIGMDWDPNSKSLFNSIVVKQSGKFIDFVSLHWYPNHINVTHRYEGRIHPTPKEIMSNYLEIPFIVDRVYKLFFKNDKGRKEKVEITFLEWDSAWDAPNSDLAPFSEGILQWSLANAIFHADCFGKFAENNVGFSTQYHLQDINYGLIRGWDKNAGWGGQRWDGKTVRPKAFAIEMFSKYFGDVLIDSKIENAPYYIKKGDWWPDSYTGEVPYISCYASKFSVKNTLSLVLINKHEVKGYEVKINIDSINLKDSGKLYILNGPDLMSGNERDSGNVSIKEFNVNDIKNQFQYIIPAHSVNILIIDYEN